MKRLLLTLTISLTAHVLFAQNPVHWNFFVKKVADKTYEIHLVATIDTSWHTYSQTQPVDAIASPTKISFHSNPLVWLQGTPKETGRLEKYKNETLGISANQYFGKVEFIQRVVLKAAVKIAIAGEVQFQACTDKRCLPPKIITFSLSLP